MSKTNPLVQLLKTEFSITDLTARSWLRDQIPRILPGGRKMRFAGDVGLVKAAIKPLDEFTEHGVTWTPDRRIEIDYGKDFAGRLNTWHNDPRRVRCLFAGDFSDDNRPPRRKQFWTRGESGGSLCQRYFHVKFELDAAYKAMLKLRKPEGCITLRQAVDRVARAEAAAGRANLAGIRVRILNALKDETIAGEKRILPAASDGKNGRHEVPEESWVIDPASVDAYIKSRKTPPVREDKRRLILPADAAKEFGVGKNTLLYRETHPSPAGKKLEVVYAPARQTVDVNGHEQTRFLRGEDGKGVKHYVYDQVQEQYGSKDYGWLADSDGSEWGTKAALLRKRGVHGQALDRWHKKEWVDTRDEKRRGPGKGTHLTYYRVTGGARSVDNILAHRQGEKGRIKGFALPVGNVNAAETPALQTAGPRRPGPKPNLSVQNVHHICAEIYFDEAYDNQEKKRHVQLLEIWRKLGDSRKVPNVRTMRTYATRHQPDTCPTCKNRVNHGGNKLFP